MASTIVTHNGLFHADEVLGCAILLNLHEFRTYKIIRTRDASAIKKHRAEGAFLLDVGGVYDSTTWFDHHMSGGVGARDSGVPYATAGLVWKAYGPDVIRQFASRYPGVSFSTDAISAIWNEVDKNLIAPVDASDTGYAKGGVAAFSSVISGFNPTWMDRSEDRATQEKKEDDAFGQAVSVASLHFDNVVVQAIARQAAKDQVEAAIQVARGHFDARQDSIEGRLLMLDRFLPWQGHLIDHPTARNIEYVIFYDGFIWKIQGVPVSAESFELKRPLPEAWRGLSGSEIKAVTQDDDATFCHPTGFIAGALTKEGIMRLARLALA